MMMTQHRAQTAALVHLARTLPALIALLEGEIAGIVDRMAQLQAPGARRRRECEGGHVLEVTATAAEVQRAGEYAQLARHLVHLGAEARAIAALLHGARADLGYVLT
jgi:hypothetical protein